MKKGFDKGKNSLLLPDSEGISLARVVYILRCQPVVGKQRKGNRALQLAQLEAELLVREGREIMVRKKEGSLFQRKESAK